MLMMMSLIIANAGQSDLLLQVQDVAENLNIREALQIVFFSHSGSFPDQMNISTNVSS